jgi:hypothetical protein
MSDAGFLDTFLYVKQLAAGTASVWFMGWAHHLRLNGYTKLDRLLCGIRLREEITQTCSGWITDFFEYSNISLCLHFEIAARRVPLLLTAIERAEVRLLTEGDAVLKEFASELESEDELRCSLQVTFVHNEPDLRRHIPAVPG